MVAAHAILKIEAKISKSDSQGIGLKFWCPQNQRSSLNQIFRI